MHSYSNPAKARLVGGPMHDKMYTLMDGRVHPITLTGSLADGRFVRGVYIPWRIKGEVVWAYDTLCENEIIELLKKRDKEVFADIERRGRTTPEVSSRATKDDILGLKDWLPSESSNPEREQEDETDVETPDEAGW